MKGLRFGRFGILGIVLGIGVMLLLSSASPSFAEEEEEERESELEELEEDFEKGRKKRPRVDDEDGWLDFFGDIVGFVLRIAWMQRHVEMMDHPPLIAREPWRFEPYPYAMGDAFSFRSAFGKRYFLVPRLTYHHLSSGLNGLVTAADVRFWSRWGVHAQYARYTEELFRGHRELDFCAVSFKYTFVQASRLYLEVGMGPKGLSGRSWKCGPNLGLWARGFPTAPLVLDFGVEAASINNAPLSELSVGVGLMRGNLEFRVGFRSWQSEHHTLNGLEMGISAWL